MRHERDVQIRAHPAVHVTVCIAFGCMSSRAQKWLQMRSGRSRHSLNHSRALSFVTVKTCKHISAAM